MGGRQVVDGEEDVLGPEVLGALSVAQGEQEQLRVADLVGMTQRQMSVRVDLHQQRKLMEMVGEGEEREKARLVPGNDRRPADVLIRNWVGGKDAALDVTVVTSRTTHARCCTHSWQGPHLCI